MYRVAAFAAVVALSLGGCDDNPPLNPPSDFFISITYSPPAITFPVGGSAVINVVVTRGANYGGTITLAAEGLPATILPTFDPPILTGSTDRGTLTLTAGPGTVAGTCPFVIRASGPDVDDAVTPTISCAVTGQ